MENNNKQFLPQYTLDQLSQRVCSGLPFCNFYNTWEGIPELCMKIEAEPRAVDSAILMVQNKHDTSIEQNVNKYHLVLTRVYILLYYRHRDDQIYQALVFPELIKNMGRYAGDDLRNVIQPEINKILELDQLVMKAKEEEKKNIKPLFAYVPHSMPALDRLCIEYNEERLFLEMTNIIKDLSTRYETHLDEANVWYNAKQVVHTLREIDHPEYLIERVAKSLVYGQIYNEYEGSQIIMICVYVMVRATKNNSHFSKFVSAMEALSFKDTNLLLIKNQIGAFKSWIDKHTPFDGYDYIGDTQTPTDDVFTKADVERMVSEYKAQIENFEKQLAQKEKMIADLQMKVQIEDEDGEVENRKDNDKVLYNKVCYEFFLQLLEIAGLNINNTNKTDIGKLWEFFTGKAGNEIRKFSSKRNYKNNHTIKDIKTLNELLDVLKITNVKL